jgi:hypothetical protein
MFPFCYCIFRIGIALRQSTGEWIHQLNLRPKLDISICMLHSYLKFNIYKRELISLYQGLLLNGNTIHPPYNVPDILFFDI